MHETINGYIQMQKLRRIKVRRKKRS